MLSLGDFLMNQSTYGGQKLERFIKNNLLVSHATREIFNFDKADEQEPRKFNLDCISIFSCQIK